MTTATSDLLLPGYRIDDVTGAWCTLPYPTDPDEKEYLLGHTLGLQVIDWAEGYLVDKIGPGLIHYQNGTQWTFTPGQKKFLILWYAVDSDGRFVYRSGIKRGAKGPIAHSTPVMTPQGWVKHGDLAPGDLVYAADGSITMVTALRPTVIEDVYRITFRDGATVDCTGTHRWPVDVFTGAAKRRRRVLTVNEMLAMGVTYERSLTHGKTKAVRGGVARFRALPSPAVQGFEVDMPVDPYLLGYWLGDGDSGTARITADIEDMAALILELDRLGVAHGAPSHTHGKAYRLGLHGIMESLRSLGVLNSKHIPPYILRASVQQRWALMQGIVDSDGHINKSGYVEVCILDNRLGSDVFELAVSLGLMPAKSWRMVGQYGPYIRIKFAPQPGEIISRLPRKLMRCKGIGQHALPFSRSRTIVSIEKIDTAPARCLTVAHGSHQYLVGAHNVPTCNSGKDPLAAAMCNCELLGPVEVYDFDDRTGRPIGRPRGFPLIQVLANSQDQSKDVLRVANAMWSRGARECYGLDCGETRTIIKGTGARFEIPPSAEASGEGDPASFICLNESHHATPATGGLRVAAMARRNVAKSPSDIQARLIEFTNAHCPGEESVAERSFNAWQEQCAPGYFGPRDILYDSIEAPPNTDILTEAGRMAGLRAAYSDAPWVDRQRIANEMVDPRTSVADTIRYYLNGLAAEEDSWIDPRNFDALAVGDTTVVDRDRIAMFLDCSKSQDATGLVGCRLSDMFVFTIGVWQRPRGARARDWLAPRDEVDAVVRATFKRYTVCWFGVDPSPARDEDDEHLYWAHAIDSWHRDFASRLPVWATGGAMRGSSVLFDMRMSQHGAPARNQAFTEAAELVQRWVDEEGQAAPFRHDGNPVLRQHAHNARRRPNQWGTSLGKVTRDSDKLVDLAVCMVGAVMGARIALNSGKLGKLRTGKAVFV